MNENTEKTQLQVTQPFQRFLFSKLIFPAILILLTAIVSHFILDEFKKNTKTPIIVGFVEYSILGSRLQKKDLIEEFENEANELLGEYGRDYEIIVKIIKGNYEEIYRALKYDKIDIALIPPYTWILSHFDPHFRIKNQVKDYEVLGFKYPTEGIWYYSGLLYHKDNITKSDLQKETLPDLHFIINKEKKSTSTYVMPSYEMILNMDRFPTEVIHLSRKEMFDKVISSTEDNKYVGFIQSDEWDKLNNFLFNGDDLFAKEIYSNVRKLGFHKNDSTYFTPIPYDVVIGKPNSKENIPYAEVVKSLKGLFLSVNNVLPEDNSNWFVNNANFIRLVLSGIISRDKHSGSKVDGDKNNKWYLYFLNDRLHNNFFNNQEKDTKCIIYKLSPTTEQEELNLKYPFKLDSVCIVSLNNKPTNTLDATIVKNIRGIELLPDLINLDSISKKELLKDKPNQHLIMVPQSINDSLRVWLDKAEVKKEKKGNPPVNNNRDNVNGFIQLVSILLFVGFFIPIVLILFISVVSYLKKP